LVNPLPAYDFTAMILWVNFVPYNITALVNYTNKPDIWATLNQTAIQQPYESTAYWTLDVEPGDGTIHNEHGHICWPEFCFCTEPFSFD